MRFRQGLIVLLALALLLGAYSLLRHLPDPRQAPPTASTGWSERLLLMLRALGDYTGLIFFPARLQMCRAVSTPLAYASPAAWQQNIGYEYLSLLGAGTIAAFVAGLRAAGQGSGVRRLGVLWFWIGFLPVSNLFPLNAQVAEHWIYMPSIGYLVFLAGCGLDLPRHWCRPAIGALAVALVCFTVRTRIRSEDWTSPDRFYWTTLARGTYDPRIMGNIANSFVMNGRQADAEKMLRAILRDRPDYLPARVQLGHVLIALGRQAEADSLLRDLGSSENERKYTITWAARLGLAQIQASQGHSQEALATIEKALVGNPQTEALLNAKITLLQGLGRAGEAIAIAQGRCRKAWWDISAHRTLARLLLSGDQPDAALTVLRHVAWLDVWKSDSLSLAAQVELYRHRPAAALIYQERAIRRDPAPKNYLVLAGILRHLHRDQDAEAALVRARSAQ